MRDTADGASARPSRASRTQASRSFEGVVPKTADWRSVGVADDARQAAAAEVGGAAATRASRPGPHSRWLAIAAPSASARASPRRCCRPPSGRCAPRSAKAAVDACDHALAADDVGVAADALRHQPRMLDEVGGGIDHAGDQDLVVRDRDLLQVLPFVIVARVGGLDADRLRPRLEGEVDDLGERQVVIVRTFVIAPADVQPHRGRPAGLRSRALSASMLRAAIRRNSSSERWRYWLLRQEPRSGQSICSTKPGIDDRAVLGLHDVGERLHIGVLGRIVQVDDEARQDAGRRRRHERVGGLRPCGGRLRCAMSRSSALRSP